MKSLSRDLISQFQPYQIVFLACENCRLYAEVVQVIADRQLCWARPLLLAVFPPVADSWQLPTAPDLRDLRQGADLLLPLHLFQPAMDAEVIPLISQLSAWDGGEDSAAARQQVNQFIRQLWRSHPQEFGQSLS